MMVSKRLRVRLLMRFALSTQASISSTSVAGTPPPVRVGFTENAGRGAFATREIRTSDLIHTADPVVAHPSLPVSNKVCYSCLRWLKQERYLYKGLLSLPLENAKGANALYDSQNEVHFCSIECTEQAKGFYEIERKINWSLYHEQCRNKGLKYPLLAKRLACMVISGTTSADCLDILQPANFSDGMGMPSMWEDEFELVMHTFKDGGIQPERLAFLTKEWYLGVLARIRANVFRIKLIEGYHADLLTAAAASISIEAAVGNAVYMLPSMYNHDCDPNIHILWLENAKARLKALRNIEAGEELRICYIDASMDYKARQSLLYHSFGFQCQCLRCMSGD